MTDHKNGTSGKKTLVEEGTQFKGALSSNCPIEVKGRIEGEITAPALGGLAKPASRRTCPSCPRPATGRASTRFAF